MTSCVILSNFSASVSYSKHSALIAAMGCLFESKIGAAIDTVPFVFFPQSLWQSFILHTFKILNQFFFLLLLKLFQKLLL